MLILITFNIAEQCYRDDEQVIDIKNPLYIIYSGFFIKLMNSFDYASSLLPVSLS